MRRITLKSFLKKIYPFVCLIRDFRPPHPKFRYLVYSSFLLIPIVLFVYIYIFKDLPSPKSLSSQPVPLTTHIRDRYGTELYKIYRQQNRTLVKLSDLPKDLVHAVLSIEDKNFYRHKGFSIQGITRALINNLKSCNRSVFTCRLNAQGGSTITQQLVKTSLLSSERTFQRKLRELVLSLWVETIYSKDQILEMYLNRVSFGGSAYGIEEASQTYFGKSSIELNLSEASLLAGLPASPTTYSPFGAHPELAKTRQKEVLRRMVEDQHITWDKAEESSATELQFIPPSQTIKAPHFVMFVKEMLSQKYGPELVEQGGLDVTTSLDLGVQEQAQKIVFEETAKIAHLNVSNGATLITNPATGDILAMVGSRNYFDIKNDGNVNVTIAERQPGSSIKPLNYALALSRGFTPASIIDDSPITYKTPGQPPYSPTNYDRRYHGRVSLRTALGSSYNIPAVKLLSANGVSDMVEMGQKLGITTWDDPSRYGLSLTLGGGEVTMLDMTTLYGVFANYGKKVAHHPILSVKDASGNILEKFDCPISLNPTRDILTAQAVEALVTEITTCPAEEVLDPKIAFLITDILSDNTARTPAFGPRSDLVIPNYQVAVKTGTTNSLRDNWTIGFTQKYLVAVWVGNNNNSPMSYIASGVTGASPIWKKIMQSLVSHDPPVTFTAPPGLAKLPICTLTGQLACKACPYRMEYFTQGTEPKSACSDESIQALLAPTPTGQLPPRDKLLRGIQIQIH